MDFTWWNLIPTYFDGTAIQLGNFPIRWYGLMYLFAFATCYAVIWRTNVKEKIGITKEQMDSFATWVIGGILVGARLGYVLFYNPQHYFAHPLEILLPFRYDDLQGFYFVGISGMSYHGGLLGAIFFGITGIKRNKLPLWKLLNLGFLAVPLGYSWGRWGNFVNGELYGEVTTSPMGMLFPMTHDLQLRHPSQLYEMCFEGLILFAILFTLRRLPLFRNQMMALYLMGYGIFRFFIEFFRHPDNFLGRNDFFQMSRGQTLCSIMITAGIILFIMEYRRERATLK
ncbi:MAG: prolipoprotein diacylglyceryl transferase [Fibrobacteres bacterium CG2_30_45_31]|nr:MAG: prolipoprotein diacylglyceryl transferase [Fibrobacteres bacterium CG2_30_45_31]